MSRPVLSDNDRAIARRLANALIVEVGWATLRQADRARLAEDREAYWAALGHLDATRALLASQPAHADVVRDLDALHARVVHETFRAMHVWASELHVGPPPEDAPPVARSRPPRLFGTAPVLAAVLDAHPDWIDEEAADALAVGVVADLPANVLPAVVGTHRRREPPELVLAERWLEQWRKRGKKSR